MHKNTLNMKCASFRAAAKTSSVFHQDQLNKAVQYGDLEACTYLLTHHGSEKNLKLSVDQLKQVISTSFHRHQPEVAVEIVRRLPNSNPRNYSVLMKECLRRRNMKVLEKVLEARKAAGHKPDAYTATAQLTALGMTRRAGDVMAALCTAWEIPQCRTIEVCNAAVGSCATCGDLATAEAVLDFLVGQGLLPDVVTYNSLIKAAAAARLMPKVQHLYVELQLKGLTPTQVTYTSVFSASARTRFNDANWLFQVRQKYSTVNINSCFSLCHTHAHTHTRTPFI